MSATLPTPPDKTAKQSPLPVPLSCVDSRRQRSHSEELAWGAIVLLLVLVVPLFLCLPLCCDIDFFNILARSLSRGELLYKEVLLYPFSGLALIYAGVRAIVGWSSEALRATDLLIMGGAVWLLAWRLPLGLSRAARAWLLFVLLLFYLGTSEWCHGQPDTWMLLPAAAALCLRCRQIVQVTEPQPIAGLGRRAVLEGVCWGIAFTIKAFVAIPALACAALTVVVAFGSGRTARKRLALDLGGVLLGGLLVGAACAGWLYFSGNWPYFRENLRQSPNMAEYYARSFGWGERLRGIVVHLWPWSAVQWIALPLAVVALLRAVGASATAPAREPRELIRGMLAACYLGWFIQANFLQHQFDYHLVAPIMLALALVASQERLFRPWYVRYAVLPALLVVALAYQPLLQPSRLLLWDHCWKGTTPDLRERLGTLDKEQARFMPTWPELAAVERFLQKQKAGDGEVVCWSNSSLAVHSDLGIQPGNRYVMLCSWQGYMPQRMPQIEKEVMAGPRRFIITDLHENFKLPLSQIRGWDLSNLTDWPWPWPWSQPVLFRAGRYIVHKAK